MGADDQFCIGPVDARVWSKPGGGAWIEPAWHRLCRPYANDAHDLCDLSCKAGKTDEERLMSLPAALAWSAFDCVAAGARCSLRMPKNESRL